ncbi:hypothetical protein [Nocardiopsis nanhaiensis]
MVEGMSRQARWPAYTMAALLLGYAVGKAVYAVQGRLGFPGGPAVPAGDYARYAAQSLDVAAMQWAAVVTGLIAALFMLATVTGWGRRVPRPLMLALLGAALLGVGAGALIVAADGFLGIGPGWQWYQGVFAIGVLALLVVTTRSYARATRPRLTDRSGARG